MPVFRKEKASKTQGQASVEFLLTSVFLIVVVLWAVQMSAYLYTYVTVADAAKEGVRYAVVHGCGTSASFCSGSCTTACTDTTGTKVVSAVTNYANFLAASNVTVTYVDGNSVPPNRVQVTVSYPYVTLFALGWTPPAIKAAAEGRIAN